MQFFTSEIYINNNNPLKIGVFLTIFKDFCNKMKIFILQQKWKYIGNMYDIF
jgi:hypothetical protein